MVVFIFFILMTAQIWSVTKHNLSREKHKYVLIDLTKVSIEDGNPYEGTLSTVISSRAVSQILDFFLDHKEFDYSPGEIAKKTGLSFRTIFRELPGLERQQLIFVSRKIGKTSMYKLNTDFRATEYLEKFALEISQLQLQDPETPLTESDISELS
jgi:hypothetical protein